MLSGSIGSWQNAIGKSAYELEAFFAYNFTIYQLSNFVI